MKTCRVTYSILAVMLALAGCVREEEALIDSQSPPIGNGGTLAITAPAAMSSEAMGPTTVLDIGQATASGGDGAYTFSNDAPAGGFGLGVSVVNWTVQDGAGASAGASQNITVSDTSPPTVIKPADMQVVSTGTLTMVDIGTATATDLVDGDPTISNDMPAAGFPMGTTAVSWTATDDSGNSATATQMVTVSIATGGPLTIEAPSNISQEATAPLSVIVLGAATVTGGEAPMMISNDAPANGFPVGQATVTWTVTDNAMTTVTATQQVAVTDSIAPQLTAPSDITTSQGPELGNTTVLLGTATASDTADSNPAITNDAPANGFGVGTTTVTWTATDGSGNTTTAAQTVTVNAYVAEQCSALLSDFQNTIYPIMNTANPPRCVGCHTGTTNPVVTQNNFAFLNDPPTAADLEVFRTVALIDSGTESLLTVKALGGENHGGGNLFPNAANDPDFVELYDFVSRARNCITEIQIIAPAPANAEATGALTMVNIGQATANGGDGAYTFSNDAPAGGFSVGTTVVNWSVQDGAGATDTATQDVTVSDTTAPTLTPPPNVQVDSTGTLTMVDIGTATASDLVDGNPTVSNNMPAAGFPEGITAVTWTATDANGNSATATQMVTVSAPTIGQLAITPPANVSQEATAQLSAVALGMPNVTGGVAPVMISNDAPANGFPVGQTTVNWAATDSESTTVTATQQVVIVDTTAPQITVPGNVAADQGPELGSTSVDLGAASASDIVDSNPAISNDAPANGFGVGMTTVTWTATDNSGNTTTATQTVTISAYVAEQCSALLSDFQSTIYPIMNTANPPRCVGCHTGTNDPDNTPNNFAFLNDPPTAADLAVFRTVAMLDSGTESLLTVKARGGDNHSGGDRFPDGLNDPDFVELSSFVSRARACITELQVIAPAAISTEATGSATTVDIGQATANGGDGTYTFSNDAPVGGFGLGTTVVNWTVQDGAGASDTATQDIAVSDTTAPTVTAPASVQADSTGTLTMLDIGTATATDVVDGNLTISSDMPAAGFPEGVTVVTWTATDASGNAGTATQTVTVSAPSNAPLAIAAPANISQEATAQLSAVSLGAPTVTGGVAPVTISNDAPANGFPVGQTTVNWAATDSESTTVTATQQVVIVDTTAPQITVPGNVAADQGPELGSTSVDLGAASASDIVDSNPAISNDAPANGFGVGMTTVTWTATDNSGNTTTATQTVTISAYVAEQCSALLSDFQSTIYPIMNTANPPRCVGCHTGTNDPDNTPNNFAFLNDPPTAADLAVFRTVAMLDSGTESLLTVKARGGDNHSGGDRFPDGLNDPDFVELSSFVSRARACITELQVIAPAAISTEATGSATTVDIGQATANGGDGTYTFSNDAPVGGFGLGTTVVNWTVQDGAGASDTATQDIAVSDTTAPTVTAPASVQADSTGTLTMLDIGTATATDVVDGNLTISSDMPAAGFPEGVTVVTWTATDASGNAGTATQTVTVSAPSNAPLAIAAPANISQEATAQLSAVSLGAPTVTGGVAPVMISNDAPANGFTVGQTTVNWAATDSESTTATTTQQVVITDTTAPQLTVPADIIADQSPTLGNTNVQLGVASANDLADPNPAISNNAPANGYPVGTTTVTWTAQDANGNSGTAAQTVTINAYVAELCSALVSDFQNTVYPIMNSTSPPRCNGCHTGTSNPRNTPNGFAFLNNPPTAADFEVFRTVARINSGSESLVTVKARGGAGHAGGDLFPDGSNDVDYVEFSNFVARARNCEVGSTSTAKVILGTGYEQLHRIVLTLGSRVPTQDEVNLVATASDQAAIDTALSAIVDGLMNEDAFIERVQEMYNDLLLTDKYNTFRNPLDENYDLDGWSNKDYYENNFSGDTRSNLRELGNYGISRAPMALVEYIIRNNRPFSELLTADYMMVNPYSAVIYGVNAGDASFPFSSDRNQSNHDRDDFRRVTNVVQTSGDRAPLPLAGVIGTHSFLARYPSSFTNVNRHRARFVFDYFLGINIEGLAPRDGVDFNNVVGAVPTYEDPQCTVCHVVMDPIAGLFTKREYKGEYDTGNNYLHNQTTSGVPRMVPAGMSLDPADVLPTSEESRPLKWMVQRLAADDRFADKTVRTVFKGLTSIEATAPSTNTFINDTKVRFVSSNFDFKALVKDIILSDYFRAQNLAAGESPSQYVDFGAGRTITPEELNRRIRSVAGGNYSWSGPNSNGGLSGIHYMLYGGIDSDDVTVRTTEPNSLMDGIQERIANQVSCERVANDLYNSGVLFPIADEADTPDTTPGETAIRQNIVHLHRHLLGEDFGTSDAEVNATYQLFVDARALGQTAIPSQCRGGGSSTDGNRTVLPWMAVVTYLLSDYRFLYQ